MNSCHVPLITNDKGWFSAAKFCFKWTSIVILNPSDQNSVALYLRCCKCKLLQANLISSFILEHLKWKLKYWCRWTTSQWRRPSFSSFSFQSYLHFIKKYCKSYRNPFVFLEVPDTFRWIDIDVMSLSFLMFWGHAQNMHSSELELLHLTWKFVDNIPLSAFDSAMFWRLKWAPDRTWAWRSYVCLAPPRIYKRMQQLINNLIWYKIWRKHAVSMIWLYVGISHLN